MRLRLLRLAEMLGVARENIYCAGDNENDLPMLRVAAEAFAPNNAIGSVLACSTVVCHCGEGAIADIIEILDKRYN